MIEYTMESDCVSCERCHNCGRNEKKPVLESLKCDQCGNEADVLYEINGKQYCAECVLQDFEEINEENFEEFI